MKAKWYSIALVLGILAANNPAGAQFDGKTWVNAKFPNYNVTKIAIAVSGSWQKTSARLNNEEIVEALTVALEDKGYEIIVPSEREEPDVDAVLKIVYHSSTPSSLGYTRLDGTGKHGTGYNYSVKVRAQLVTKAKKVVIYEASGTIEAVAEPGRAYAGLPNPSYLFDQVVSRLPSKAKAPSTSRPKAP